MGINHSNESILQASRALKEAADVIQANPVALQLRHLQALNSIAYVHQNLL